MQENIPPPARKRGRWANDTPVEIRCRRLCGHHRHDSNVPTGHGPGAADCAGGALRAGSLPRHHALYKDHRQRGARTPFLLFECHLDDRPGIGRGFEKRMHHCWLWWKVTLRLATAEIAVPCTGSAPVRQRWDTVLFKSLALICTCTGRLALPSWRTINLAGLISLHAILRLDVLLLSSEWLHELEHSCMLASKAEGGGGGGGGGPCPGSSQGSILQDHPCHILRWGLSTIT